MSAVGGDGKFPKVPGATPRQPDTGGPIHNGRHHPVVSPISVKLPSIHKKLQQGQGASVSPPQDKRPKIDLLLHKPKPKKSKTKKLKHKAQPYLLEIKGIPPELVDKVLNCANRSFGGDLMQSMQMPRSEEGNLCNVNIEYQRNDDASKVFFKEIGKFFCWDSLHKTYM